MRGLEESPELERRSVFVLNAASAGFEQPQTLKTANLLASLGQRIDAALIVDGFNEVALSLRNWQTGYQPLAPSIGHLSQIDRDVERYRLTPGSEQDPAECVAGSIAHWERCSRLTHEVLDLGSTPALQVLQPNQDCSAKILTSDERRRAVSSTNPYRLGVELGYPGLKASVKALAPRGHQMHDATDVFDDVAGAVFADNCCHYNQRGNQVLVDSVLPRLREVIGEGRGQGTGESTTQSSRLDSHLKRALGQFRSRAPHRGRGPTSDAGDASGAPLDDMYPMW